jgi:hypothetical protein
MLQRVRFVIAGEFVRDSRCRGFGVKRDSQGSHRCVRSIHVPKAGRVYRTAQGGAFAIEQSADGRERPGLNPKCFIYQHFGRTV